MKTVTRLLSIALVSSAFLTGCDLGIGSGTCIFCVPSAGDASLSSLSISGAMLEPPFSSSNTLYVARVPYSTTSVEISATTSDSSSSFTINGINNSPITVPVAVGSINPHDIKVTAQGGATRTYSIVVIRASYAIDTTVGWNGTESAAPFGDGGATEVFGQTFVVLADAPTLQRLSFSLQHSPDDTSGEDLFFSVVVMAWNIDRATGPILYESQLQSITTAQSMMTEYLVDTGGLILVPGEEYVAFLSANNGSWDATSTLIRVGFQNSDVYFEGAAWTLDSDNNPGLITSAAWDNTFGTADFVVMFTF